jgi:hypothetical protein
MKSKSMRGLIDLIEAKKVAAPAIQPQEVHDKTLQLSKIIATRIGIHAWDQSWVDSLKNEIALQERMHDSLRADAHEDGENTDETFEPFSIIKVAPDALVSCWDKVEAQANITDDAAYELREYSRENPQTEMSDTIFVLKAEHDMGSRINRNGGLGSLNSMNFALSAMEEYSEEVEHNSNVERFRNCTPATEKMVSCGIPMILFYTKLLGAKKP